MKYELTAEQKRAIRNEMNLDYDFEPVTWEDGKYVPTTNERGYKVRHIRSGKIYAFNQMRRILNHYFEQKAEERKANNPIKEMLEYGCFAKLEDGEILTAAMNLDGSMEQDNWSIVTAPDSEGFLAGVNLLFGTSFAMSDPQFCGR